MLEFEILAHGLFRPEQLAITYDPTLRLSVTPETQAWMDEVWQQKLARARETGTLLFDASLFRFVSADVEHEGRLRLVVGDTSYKEYVTTRMPEFAQGRRRDELGIALSVSSVVETSDNYILLDRRQGVDVYVGRYHVIGGFFERNLDMTSGAQPDPFAAMRREIREETGIQADDISESYCLGVVYDVNLPHGELCFLHRLHIPLSVVQTREPEDEEITQLVPLQVTAESLRGFILEHHGNISATGEPNLLMYGGWKFGRAWFDEVLGQIR